MSARAALVLAALLMAAAVAAGAFGAHALRTRVDAAALGVWSTAVQYHAWHALGLLAVGLFMLHAPDRAGLPLAGWLFVAGIVLFSGSLYALALGARARRRRDHPARRRRLPCGMDRARVGGVALTAPPVRGQRFSGWTSTLTRRRVPGSYGSRVVYSRPSYR